VRFSWDGKLYRRLRDLPLPPRAFYYTAAAVPPTGRATHCLSTMHSLPFSPRCAVLLRVPLYAAFFNPCYSILLYALLPHLAFLDMFFTFLPLHCGLFALAFATYLLPRCAVRFMDIAATCTGIYYLTGLLLLPYVTCSTLRLFGLFLHIWRDVDWRTAVCQHHTLAFYH